MLEHRARLLECECGRLHLALLLICRAELLQVASEFGRVSAGRVLLDRIRLLVERDRLLVHTLGREQVGERRDGLHHVLGAAHPYGFHELDGTHEHQ